MLQVNLVPVHTIYLRTYIVRSTSWYQPGTSLQYSSYGWNFSLVIGAHTTTKLHELKTALDASRWMEVQITGPTNGDALEIGGVLVACEAKDPSTERQGK